MSQVAAARGAAPADPAASRPRLVVVSAVGVAQILAWGSSYYLLAVLAGPVVADTGWPLTWLMGALSIGMLVSGLVSPRIGFLIEQAGGRASTGVRAVLDVQPESLHQRVGFVFGSKEEVERIERYHHEPLIGGEQDELPLFHARSLFRDTEFTQ